MKILLRPVQSLYRLIRRLSIVDATRLMHLRENDCQFQELAKGYIIRTVGANELSQLLDAGLVNAQVGDPSALVDGRRVIVAAFRGDRLVSFLWIARHSIDAANNYSRAAHLGTSIDLPEGTGFVFNAWTDPDHRGGRLIGSLLSYAIKHRVAGATSLLTSIDWTNQKSIRAFAFIGMRSLGTVVRIGRGRMQLSLIPQVARLGLRIARDTPGYKFAV